MTRLVTLITVSTGDAEHMMSPKAMATAHSVGQQVGVTPDQFDLLIIRDVGDFSLADLHRLAAEQAQTEWMSFIPEGEVLKPSALAHAIPRCTETTADAVGCDGLLLWRRDYYLKRSKRMTQQETEPDLWEGDYA